MELKKLLHSLFENNSQTPEFMMPNTLDYKQLSNIVDSLLDCDEFKETDSLDIIKIPHIENDRGEIIRSQTYKLKDNIKFKGRAYIQSISMSPEMFDPESIHHPVKDGACITPTTFDSKSFKPVKKICMQFSPEDIQDDINKKTELVNLFKKVLDSPDEYRIKGENVFMIRGIFEAVSVDGVTTSNNIGNLNLDYMNQKNFMVSYMKTVSNDDGTVGVELKHEFIPSELKDAFKDEFGDNPTVTKEDIDKFLEKHN